MDKYKLAKLSEMSMSGYLAGQSKFNKSIMKLKPDIRSARYYIFSSDLKPTIDNDTNDLFIVSDFLSGKLVSVVGAQKKLVVKELASDIEPLGLFAIDNGRVLAAIDEKVDGTSFLKYFTRNGSGKLSLMECLTKTDDGNLTTCLTNNNEIKYPANISKDWKPKDIIETKSGNITICDAYSTCHNRLSTYTPCGRLVVSFGRSVGPGNSTFVRPLHMTLDPLGRILASDWETGLVHIFDSRGFWLKALGGSKIHSNEGRTERPGGISCDHIGNIYISDVSQARLVMYSSGGQFVENIISKSRSFPLSVRINQSDRIMAISYVDKRDHFKKFNLTGLPVP